MLGIISLVIIGIIFCVHFISRRDSKVTIHNVIDKIFASIAFVITAVAGALLFKTDFNFSCAIICGAIMGMIGDIMLDLQFVCPEIKDYLLKNGFIFFGCGHYLYACGMILGHSLFKPLPLIIAVAVGIIAAIVMFFAEKLMKMNFGKHKTAVTIYTGILSFTTTISLFGLIYQPGLQSALRFTGFILFMISDAVLCNIYFAENKNTKPYIVVCHSIYYAAQYLIAISLCF